MHRICNAGIRRMKTTTIPPLRVTPELREQAEAVLAPGETLSGFVLDALNRNIEYRKSRQEFIARGMASAAKAGKTGKYVAAEKVIGKLSRRLAKAKQRAA
jgi:predicted transcriptional regulator